MTHEVDESLNAGLAAWGATVRTSTASQPAGVGADEVWSRGRRWGHRRAAARIGGGLVSLALVAGLGVGLVGAAPEVVPAATGTAQVPDELFDMPAWGDDLEPQPLVALTIAERGTWRGPRVQAAGISAATGAYGYLDLPGLVGMPALSPDGKQVAWWSSLTQETAPDATSWRLASSGATVRGVQVMDLETGEVVSHREESRSGVLPQQLVWTGDEPTLVFSRVPAGADGEPDLEQGYRAFTWVRGQDVEAWPWREGTVAEHAQVAPGIELAEEDDLAPLGFMTASRGGVYVSSGDGATSGLLAVDPGAGRVLDVPAGDTAVTEQGASSIVWSREGRLAAMAYPTSASGVAGSLVVGRLDLPVNGDSRAELQEVPGAEQPWQVLGWRGDEVVVRDFSGDDDEIRTVVVEGDDAGESTVLTRHRKGLANEEGTYRVGWLPATDLLGSAPVVEASAPHEPRDPRVLVGASLVGLVLLLGGLGWWWRRARP